MCDTWQLLRARRPASSGVVGGDPVDQVDTSTHVSSRRSCQTSSSRGRLRTFRGRTCGSAAVSIEGLGIVGSYRADVTPADSEHRQGDDSGRDPHGSSALRRRESDRASPSALRTSRRTAPTSPESSPSYRWSPVRSLSELQATRGAVDPLGEQHRYPPRRVGRD